MNQLITIFITFFYLIPSITIANTEENIWDIYYSDSQIVISTTKIPCEYNYKFNQELIIIKIQNITSNDLLVEWDNKLWYDESCVNCEKDNIEFKNKIKIESGNEIIGNCSENNNLRIFSKFTENIEDMPGVTKITELTKFKFENIKIENE